MRTWTAAIVLLAGAPGCMVNVAALKLAAPQLPAAQAVRTATSRGWREGESCSFWLGVIPFGLPQVDEAMNNALLPVHGAYMRDITVYSVHPVYVLFGWHCYRVVGEVFGADEDKGVTSDQ